MLAVELAKRAALETNPQIELTVLESAEDALEWLNSIKGDCRPKVIVLDLKLPKLDGLAVLRMLRMHEITCDIPVVVFSDAYTHEEVLLSYKVGANTFVNKPTDLAEFRNFLSDRLLYWMQPREPEISHAG